MAMMMARARKERRVVKLRRRRNEQGDVLNKFSYFTISFDLDSEVNYQKINFKDY